MRDEVTLSAAGATDLGGRRRGGGIPVDQPVCDQLDALIESAGKK